MMGSYCGMPSGQTRQDSWNNIQLHFYKRWRKTMNKGQARRHTITIVEGVRSINLCSSAAYALFFQLFCQITYKNTIWRMEVKLFFQYLREPLTSGNNTAERARLNIRDQSIQWSLFPPTNKIILQDSKINKLTVVFTDDCTDRCQTRKTNIH